MMRGDGNYPTERVRVTDQLEGVLRVDYLEPLVVHVDRRCIRAVLDKMLFLFCLDRSSCCIYAAL